MEQKEERIRAIALSYYSRKDVLDAIFKFSHNREVSPRYFEGFGKRPDSFQYPADILSLVKRGATSFHCSEEIWSDPMQLSTDLNQEQLNNLRTGWDLVIDIDCKWIDYSKKAAQSIIQALKFRGVENIGVKFSGSKGFHIIIPWQAFPDEINGIKTKEMFPEWPKAIVLYLKELSRPILQNLIKDMGDDFVKEKGFTGIKCETCNNLASESYQITVRCNKCYPSHIETFKSSSPDYKAKKCPVCMSIMLEQSKKKFYICNTCNIDSIENPGNFNEEIIATDIFKILGLDLQLVSSRHLFRMPYSLHEKTALASIVLDKNKINEFTIKDADPLNIKILDFLPNPKKDEAKELLIQSLDVYNSQKPEDKKISFQEPGKKEFKKIEIKDLKDEYFPPTINNILKGMDDGKKRGLFILMNFYRSLSLSMEDIEKRLNEWNAKNNPPLKQGYINNQLIWHSKQKSVLPPNFSNDIYKEIGVLELDTLSEKTKNPVSYVIRKSGAWKTQIEKPKRAPRAKKTKKSKSNEM